MKGLMAVKALLPHDHLRREELKEKTLVSLAVEELCHATCQAPP
jgi:hypothetical protein